MEDNKKKSKLTIRSFSVNKESYELLTNIAEEEDVSVSHIVRSLIDQYLSSHRSSNKENKQQTNP